MKALTVLILVLVAATANAASHRPRCFGAAARDPEHPCVNHRLNRTVTPKPADAVIQPSAPCAIIRRTKPAVCAFGTKDVKPTVALIGDSHARHWVAALTRVAHRDRWRGVSITRTRCPFSFARKPDHPCIGWVRRDLRWLREHPKVSTVYVSSDANSGVDAPPDQAEETKIAGFIRAWKKLPASVHEVYVLHDVPHATPATNDCVERELSRHHNPGVRCARSRTAALPVDVEVEAAERFDSPLVNVIDLIPFLCSEDQCFPVVGGVLVIKDIGHLTRTFSSTLGPYIRRAVTRLRAAQPSYATPAG